MTCQGQRHAGYSPHKHGVTGAAVVGNKDRGGDEGAATSSRRSPRAELPDAERRRRVAASVAFDRRGDGFSSHQSELFKKAELLFCCRFYQTVFEKDVVKYSEATAGTVSLRGHRFDLPASSLCSLDANTRMKTKNI